MHCIRWNCNSRLCYTAAEKHFILFKLCEWKLQYSLSITLFAVQRFSSSKKTPKSNKTSNIDNISCFVRQCECNNFWLISCLESIWNLTMQSTFCLATQNRIKFLAYKSLNISYRWLLTFHNKALTQRSIPFRIGWYDSIFKFSFHVRDLREERECSLCSGKYQGIHTNSLFYLMVFFSLSFIHLIIAIWKHFFFIIWIGLNLKTMYDFWMPNNICSYWNDRTNIVPFFWLREMRAQNLNFKSFHIFIRLNNDFCAFR